MDDAIVEKDELCDELDPFIQDNEGGKSPRVSRKMTDKEKCEYLLARGWTPGRIARRANRPLAVIKRLIDEIDDEQIAAIRDGPEVMRSRQVAMLQEMAVLAFAKAERSNQPRHFRIALECLKNVRQIMGLDAPSKQINLNLTGKTLIHPADQQALIDADPAHRDELLRLNAARRALAAGAGKRAGPGGLGDPDEPAVVALGFRAAPGGDQSVAGEGGSWGMPPADDLRAAAPWEN